jgi:DNA-binding transcriptional LysR family regulator
VKQVAHGWEPHLTIALDVLLPWEPFMQWVQEFDQVARDTRLRFTREVLAGMWDALMSGEADLLVGAPGPGPSGGGYRSRVLTQLSLEFCVAPAHPLATLPGPLSLAAVEHYRAVAIADTARRMPVRTVGILEGQPVLTVADLEGKLAALRTGLGVGWLPSWVANKEAAAKRLVIKPVNTEKHTEVLYLAWRSGESGKAMNWWLRKLRGSRVVEGMDG